MKSPKAIENHSTFCEKRPFFEQSDTRRTVLNKLDRGISFDAFFAFFENKGRAGGNACKNAYLNISDILRCGLHLDTQFWKLDRHSCMNYNVCTKSLIENHSNFVCFFLQNAKMWYSIGILAAQRTLFTIW